MKFISKYIAVLIIILNLNTSSFSQVCNLICQDHVNASLRSDSCTRSFVPFDFLINPDFTCTTYSLELAYPFGTSNLSGNTVDLSHVGYTFIYRVKAGNNSCWGTLTVEDKAPPQPLCKSMTISCFQFNKINEVSKQIIDNCAQEGKSIIESLLWEDYGCTRPAITGQVIRTIRSIDKWGNSGTCTDTLLIRKDSFALIKSPDMITLSCLMSCKKAGNNGAADDRKNHEFLSFSPNKNDANYPSPELLLAIQKRDTFGTSLRKCIPENLRVVPFINDNVLRFENDTCIIEDTCIAMYPSVGLLCKLLVLYNDLTFSTCGNSFKIRREWTITNWCTGKDTAIVQYITVEDKQAPIVTSSFKLPYYVNENSYEIVIPGHRVDVTTSAHDCVGRVCIDSLKTEDCSKVSQRYTISYEDGATTKVHSGNPRDCFTLPAIQHNQITLPSLSTNTIVPEELADFKLPRGCYIVRYDINDACFNSSYTPIKIYNKESGNLLFELPTESAGFTMVCVSDLTPPTPVCDKLTQTTIDPETCWSRIYATDLDNGSKDNCCNVLHFAVAQMDTVEYYRNKFAKHMEDSCGKAAYWKDKKIYDKIIENWINCYVFRDYVDVTECKPNQLVLRVYEACGIPKYDSHIFKCSPHDWFCYNTYAYFSLWHNYQLDTKESSYCHTPWPWQCLPKHHATVDYLLSHSKKYWLPKYPGAAYTIISPRHPIETAYCTHEFYNPTLAMNVSEENKSGIDLTPGNSCSERLYSDCMITILIDDKTPPVADEPTDKFFYCDNVATEEHEKYDYATCHDFSWAGDNAKDKLCTDELGNPYNYIESIKENDSDAKDTIDGINKYYGWYGCNKYGGPHPDEHGELKACDNSTTWAPIYCRSWLILDKTDAAGKLNPFTKFDSPVLSNGRPKTEAETGKFYIWDNCWIDVTSLDSTDDSYIDKCGNGWLKRTWSVKDKCGNKVTVDQKIVTKHRSDFEVLFPEDKVTTCGNDRDLSPDAVGRPMVMDDDCELVGINYEDQKFDIVPDACYKIVRTWRVVNWCKYDPNQHARDQDIIVDDRNVADKIKRPCVYRHVKDNGDGYVSYVQIILVHDTIRPQIEIKDTTFCFYDNSCNVQSIHIPFTASDNCTDDGLISFRYEIDENPSASDLAAKRYNSSSIDKSKGDVKSLTSTQKVGTALVHVIAEDNCGNEDTTSFVLIIKDCKKPTPYCYHGIATVLMPTTGEIKVWAKDLNAGSFDNCTPNSRLKFSFGPQIKDSCKVFDCKDIPNGVSFTMEVDIYVTDETGNTDFCRTLINLQDGSGNVCNDAKSNSLSISGGIYTKENAPVEAVMLEAKSSNYLPSFKTTASGLYAFTNIPLKSPVNVKASRTDDPTNGVTTTDILKIQRHLMGIETITDPYSLVAADINNDKSITAADLIELRKVILNIENNFINNTSWRFVPKSFTMDISNPFTFPEYVDIKSLDQDELKKDFVGIKIGDVNNTVIAHSLLGTEARNRSQNLILSTEDKELKVGDVVEVKLTGNDNHTKAFQFTLSHNYLDVVNITGAALDLSTQNVGLFKNYTTISWNQTKPINIETNVPWITVLFKVNKDMKLSEVIRIHSKATSTEAFDGKNIVGVELKIVDGNGIASQTKYELYQNNPNPFTSNTTLRYELPKDEAVNISVTDIIGREVYKVKVEGKKGLNTALIPGRLFKSQGVYHYTLETKDYKETKRMVFIK